MLSEEQLVKQCLLKNRKALDELYNRYAPKMYGICLRYAKDKMEAEDLLHEGFIKVLNHLDNFRNEGSFEGWIRRIMVTTSINHVKKNNQYPSEFDIEDYSETEMVGEDVLSYLSQKELLNIIQNLPDGYRMVFNMYVIEGYKHKEIAEELGISENTSKSQLAKARKYLQERIEKGRYEESA